MIRYNILANDTVRDQFIQGCVALKAEPLGDGFSTYDYFPWWHHRAMATPTPPPPAANPEGRNGAHGGPVFGPWHRLLLLVFEFQLRRVLDDDNFRLPYWDWGGPNASAVWSDAVMGDASGTVTTGPFTFADFPVRLTDNATGNGVIGVNRPLRRNVGVAFDALSPPSNAEVRAVVRDNPIYATWSWDNSPQTGGFRRPLEIPLHNRVHRFVGGDMGTMASPNDPVFWLHHANIDRIWAAWQAHHGSPYLPGPAEPAYLDGHRLNDRMHSFLNASITPADVEDPQGWYQYDTLADVTP